MFDGVGSLERMFRRGGISHGLQAERSLRFPAPDISWPNWQGLGYTTVSYTMRKDMFTLW